MSYQIDQSGKIESTSTVSVVALANGRSKTIRISGPEKHKLLVVLKELDWPKTNYLYKVFAALIFLLIKDEKLNELEIDREYFGHESVIKDTLIYLHAKFNQTLPEISFVYVGKKSNCHKVALATFQSKLKPDSIVRAEEVLGVLYTKEKGRRLRPGRNNP